MLCLLAPLVNPYGFGLYRHVGHLLFTSGVTSLIQEYQPIPFGTGEARVVEWVVLGLIALPSFSARRMGRYDLVHVLVWLHLSLACIRHAPLFALAVAPGLARMLDGLPLARRDAGRVRLGWSAWPVATALALVLAVGLDVRLGGFSPRTWPLEPLATLDRQPIEARLFHEQDWGGMIEERCRPRRRAFLDDRFELFGKEAILQDIDAMQGGPEWDALDGRQRFEVVWVRPDRGLARRLLADPGWKVLHRDAVSVLFRHKESPAVGQARRDHPDATSRHPSHAPHLDFSGGSAMFMGPSETPGSSSVRTRVTLREDGGCSREVQG